MNEIRTRLHKPAKNHLIIIAITTTTIILSITISMNNPFYVVHSGSMLPTLKPDDIVVVFAISFEDLEIGDIIVFNKSIDGLGYTAFIHRIIEISDKDGQRVLKTKGDYSKDSLVGLDYPITENDYVGKMLFSLPYVGLFAKALNPPINYVVIAIILTSVFLLKYRKRS